MVNIAINGTGRIGMNSIRRAALDDKINIKAINTVSDIDQFIYLLENDTIQDTSNLQIKKIDSTHISLNNKEPILISHTRIIDELPFNKIGADAVLECTGAFNKESLAKEHLGDSVKKVVISAPVKDLDKAYVYGVNHNDYEGESVISTASCTTVALSSVIYPLRSFFEINSGLLTTIHSYTNDQNLVDSNHKKDLRRSRAASLNMIPTTTGAARTISKVYRDLEGKMDGVSIRVPTSNVSLIDISLNLDKNTTKDDINKIFYEFLKGDKLSIIEIDDKYRVSSDFVGNSSGAIFVPDLTVVRGSSVKLFAFYDNEYGYVSKMIDMMKYVSK